MTSAKRPGPVRLILTLGGAGFISGLLLVTVYLATKPIIERNQAEALEAAIYRVVPGSKTRKAFELKDGKLAAVESTGNALPSGEVIYGAYNDQDQLVGYAIPTEGAGFQDTIKLIYGFNPHDAKIVGMEVLDSRETPGLGDKIVKDKKFLENFHDLTVEPEVVAVKSGTKAKPNEVDSISGATISSKAVAKIIQQANLRYVPAINAATQEQAQ
jgi:electron transport complex protein RnfG